jgi:hypothetical protein
MVAVEQLLKAYRLPAMCAVSSSASVRPCPGTAPEDPYSRTLKLNGAAGALRHKFARLGIAA